MFEILKSVVYGLVEGITEWLPVSSTGHLILVENFLPFLNTSENFFDMFDVVIQLGAILAVVVLYFKNIWPIKKVDNKLAWDKDTFNLWGKILVACIPAAVVGILFDDKIDELINRNLTIGIMLILIGIVFIIVECRKKKEFRVNDIKELTYKDAAIIGLWQLIAAVLPGTSRSGATIIGALLIGISRPVAAEYTFYLAIPVMAGASLLKILKFGALSGNELVLLVVGMIVSFIISLFVIKRFMNYIKTHDFKPFAYYRIALGILVLVLIFTNVLV